METTSLYDEVMGHLRSKRIPQRRVAEGAGVPFSTVAKIAQGSVKEPSVHTIQRLADFFRRAQSCCVCGQLNAPAAIQDREAA